MIARQSHTKPLACAVAGTQTALARNMMRHYAPVNRKFIELKSMILFHTVLLFLGDLSKPLAAGRRTEALPSAIEQNTTRDAESEEV